MQALKASSLRKQDAAQCSRSLINNINFSAPVKPQLRVFKTIPATRHVIQVVVQV